MKKTFTYIISMITSAIIGSLLMYYFMIYSPLGKKEENSIKVERDVIVTDNGINEGIENIYDSVVYVENYRKTKLAGIGSGFIYDKEGYIITNHHVIENATSIKVGLSNGELVDAEILGSDEFSDIAVIKIGKKYVNNIAKLGKSEEAKVGDTVFTIGSPMSSVYAGTVTRGILSGKNRMVEVSVSSTTNDWIMNVMQTDAAINPGNSGGPLCNVNGEVIGVNSMKIVESEIEGIGFAIPIEYAIEYAKQILSGEKIKRAYLGIEMGNVESSEYIYRKENISIDSSITSGVIVCGVANNSPCANVGIEKGDVIIKIGEYNVKNVAELRYYLFKYKPNDKVNLIVKRGKEEKTFSIVLGES